MFYYFIKDQIKKTKTNKSPLIDVRLFKYSNFNIGLLVVSGFYMMLDSFFLMLSLFFQDGLAMNAIDAGTVIVVQGAGLMVSSVLAIRFIANHGKRILQAGVILIIISIALQIVVFRDESISYGLICFLLAIHGFGVGLVLPSIVNVALRGIPSEFSGTASGVYSTIYQMATALGICFIGGLFFYVLNYESSFESYYKAYSYGNVANVFLLVIVLFLLHFLPSDRLKEK